MVKEIEMLESGYPGLYWKKLKELAGGKKKRREVAESAVGENGREVYGEEVSRVFKRAFEKLGKKIENY